MRRLSPMQGLTRCGVSPGYVMLDGSGSSDADPPDQLTYHWRQIEGPVVELFQITPATGDFGEDVSTAYVPVHHAWGVRL